jgi:uncharacterized membrane protein
MHLVHPALVHFAVAFVTAGALLEAYRLFRGEEPAPRFGSSLLGIGTIVLVPVVASGYVAANTVDLPGGAAGTLAAHERQGWILLAALILLQFWKAWYRGNLPQGQRKPYALGLIVVAALLCYAAFLGGQLVYRWGVGVGQ